MISTLALAAGCGSSRDVKVSGKVATDGSVAGGGPVRVSFYELTSGADAGASAGSGLKLVDSVTLASPGNFEQTVSVEGDKVHVVAVLDVDHDNACTDGEAWARRRRASGR